MRFAALLWANLKRKKVRTALTLGSYGVALFLFGLLAAIQAAFNQGLEVAGADRLVVRNKVSLIMPLPVAYRDRIQAIQGVRVVTYASWFGGYYQDERNFFPQYAIDTATFRRVYPEFVVSPQEWSAFEADREGCVVGRQIAEKYGFEIGDRVPIEANIFQGTWAFNVRAIYDGSKKEDDLTQFWFHAKYLDERRQWGRGNVGWYVVRVTDPDRATAVAQEIDRLFANSSWETKSETESAFMAGFVKQMGNIKLLILAIGSVVFFTLLLVTGNTMAMAVRERTGELAVLKTLGFSDRAVLALVLAESQAYACLGGGAGLAAAKLFTLHGDPTGGMLPFFYFSPAMMALGLAVAALVGGAAGAGPAVMAMRLKIVEALRRV